MVRFLCAVWCWTSLTQSLFGAKILLFPFSTCTNSHLLNFEKLADLLTNTGHEVTMLVQNDYSSSRISPGVRRIMYPRQLKERQICDFHSLQDFLDTPLVDIISAFYSSTYASCESLLGSKSTLERLHEERFDLAIYESIEQCSKILADYLNIPFIVFHTSGPENIYPRHPAYMPSLLTTYSDQMTLFQRVFNTLGYMMEKGFQYVTYNKYQQLKINHGLNTSLHIGNSFNNAALRFILGDYALDYVRPVEPSHVLIGGSIPSTASTTAPDQVQELLESAPEQGVVVVSFGSLAKTYGSEWRELFASALAKLPYKVIWKYNETKPDNLGSNTLLVPWLNQAQLLTSPKIAVFVTHCGLNGAFESSQNGVPVVAIPLFADQFYQATKLSRVGMCAQLDIKYMTASQLHSTILEVGTNKLYRQNARRVAYLMGNKPVSSADSIRYWVNQVVKLKGAPHLHSREGDLTWYQYMLIDVAFIILLSLILLCFILRFTTLYLWRRTIHHMSTLVKVLGTPRSTDTVVYPGTTGDK